MENQSFNYTYSAKEQSEIEKIRSKYVPKEEAEADKLSQLRALDASVTRKGNTVSLIVGVISALVLGVGMCCCLVWDIFAVGIIVGLLGIVGIAMAYPIYNRITEKERRRIAPEIIRLSDELIK